VQCKVSSSSMGMGEEIPLADELGLSVDGDKLEPKELDEVTLRPKSIESP
jgi:hypothetical protein